MSSNSEVTLTQFIVAGLTNFPMDTRERVLIDVSTQCLEVNDVLDLNELRKGVLANQSRGYDKRKIHGVSEKTLAEVPEILHAGGGYEIMSVVADVLSGVGGVAGLVALIKLWVDDRNGRKIRIKIEDFEVEIQGGVTEQLISKAIENAKRAKKELGSDSQIVEITDNHDDA